MNSGLQVLQFQGTGESYQLNGKAFCVLCTVTITVLKKNHAFGHNQTKDSSQHFKLAEKQVEKSENLKWSMSSE